MKIILASGSPRRKELLLQMGLTFDVVVSNVEETASLENGIYEYMKQLAYIKAKDVLDKTKENRIVIGSDTTVFFADEKMGKPKDEEEAYRMLKDLQGNTCKVVSSLCVIVDIDGDIKEHLDYDECDVKIQSMTDEEIWEYIKTGEPMDKAGAFAIQGIGGKYIESISGDYYSVVGLPMNKLYNILKEYKGAF